MAVHSQDQQKAVVTSAKGRSLFSLCPRRTPRVVAEDETACTHFIVPLGTEDDLRANLLVMLAQAVLKQRLETSCSENTGRCAVVC